VRAAPLKSTQTRARPHQDQVSAARRDPMRSRSAQVSGGGDTNQIRLR
jgi:hypothetical protein